MSWRAIVDAVATEIQRSKRPHPAFTHYLFRGRQPIDVFSIAYQAQIFVQGLMVYLFGGHNPSNNRGDAFPL